MRLRQLRIEAFGPFGGTVDIDFDALNQAGQFLITGATGSGKTSILDAVCFALYGEVPGERQRARHLRSDHAAPDAEPRVTLTLDVAERLVRISRSPAWQRPKRRGAGTTTQQASVRLEQHLDGTWKVLATRLDEAGHQINQWLGMTPVQFTQVVLLPQGGFQTFLHSPTAARQAILQRLFRTDRFERVEAWFGDFRRSLNRSRQEALHTIDVITHRLAEAARGTDAPAIEVGIDALETWVNAQCAEVAINYQAALEARAEAVQAQAQTSDAHRRAVDLCTVLDRADSATQQLRQLEQSEAAFAGQLADLRTHERALTLVPLINAYAQAHAAAEAAAEDAASMLAAAGLQITHNDDLDELTKQAARERQRAEEAVTLAVDLDGLRADHQVAQARWQSATADLAQLSAAAAALPAALADVVDRIREANQAEVELGSCTAHLVQAQRGLAAASNFERVVAELDTKTQLRLVDLTRVQNLREAYQNAREARIEAMATELAGALVVGCSCPVCGSTSHPAPARTGTGTERMTENGARRRYESASVELTALDEVIAVLQAQREGFAQESQGLSGNEWEARLSAVQARRAMLVERVSALPSLHTSEDALHEQATTTQAERENLVQREAHSRAQLHTLAGQLQQRDRELTTTLGEHADPETFAAFAVARCSALNSAAAALRTSREADAAAARQQMLLDDEAAALAFSNGEQAKGALLDADAAADIDRSQRFREQTGVAAAAVLSEPSVQRSMYSPRPDLEAIEFVAAKAGEALTTAQAQVQLAEGRRDRTQAVAREFKKAVQDYRPLVAQAEQVGALSGLLEGTGADNRLRMRLSAFVLAERLRQVIAAANARLGTIGEGRYVLHYREERGAGDTRGGLGLSVLDEWTGVYRDPTTLSGGETFVVSLCLALGLADTVADESGGLRIDTLFIDEGFGSLDAQTLDSVVDILSQLSQGGRVTGVVSHVQELRERIPARLEVVPSKSGSTVRMATL